MCRKTESIFSTAIPYKDMHDVMNDVFFVYRVKLYEQELGFVFGKFDEQGLKHNCMIAIRRVSYRRVVASYLVYERDKNTRLSSPLQHCI